MEDDIRQDLFKTVNRSLERKLWWKITSKKYGLCSYCKPHRGMDNRKSRHPRTDRYKNHRE